MAISDQQIFDWFKANPTADDATIASTMDQFKVNPADVARATGANLADVQSRYAAAQPTGGLGALDTSTTSTTPSAADTLTAQILGQGNASKWQGEGFGSAEKNAADMAKILADAGITNINQFGEITKTIPASSYETEQGTQYTPESTYTTYGNKLTGQEVGNTYGERQTGNAFGGTYSGSGNTGYRVQFGPDGTPYFYTTGASSKDTGDLQMLLAAASFIPGVAPFAQGLNAAISASQGNLTGAALGALGAGQSAGFTDIAGIPITDAKNVVGGINALQTGNVAGLVNSAANYAGASLPSEARTGLTIANAANAFANNDYAGLADAAASLTGSSDAKLAASALRMTEAFNVFNATGDPTAMFNAAKAFNNTIQSATKPVLGSSSTTNNVAKTAPLSEEDISYLTPDQLAVYQSGGTQGLIDYNRVINNLNSLTGRDYDYSGDTASYDTTITPDTGATKSLSGTNTDFVSAEYDRLKSLGYTKEQISDYFDKLDALTSNLDTTESAVVDGASKDAGKLEVVGNKVADETLGNVDTNNVANTKNLGSVVVTGDRPEGTNDTPTDTNVRDEGSLVVVGDRPVDTTKDTTKDTNVKDEGSVVITADRPVVVNDDSTVTTKTTTTPPVVTPPVVTSRATTATKPVAPEKPSEPLLHPKLSYKNAYEETPLLNPLLFSLAGVPLPSQDKKENVLTSDVEEEKIKKEEEDKQKEAPALDLINFFSFAEGGMVPEHPMGQPEFYSEGGAGSTYIQGRGDGTSDQIPAMVANSEYVLPADIVSALGNGSSESGASVLDQFIKTIREHKHSNPPTELPPESKGPLEYLSSVHMKGKR